MVMVSGLQEVGVKYSHDVVRSALFNSGYFFPQGKTLVNLAPADVKKEGPLYDLPIAIGLLIGLEMVGGAGKPKVQVRGGSGKAEVGSAKAGGASSAPKFGRGAMVA